MSKDKVKLMIRIRPFVLNEVEVNCVFKIGPDSIQVEKE